MSVLVGTRQPRCLVLGLLQSLPWEISQGYPRSMKGAISQEKQEKAFFWSGGRDAVCFLILICRSPRKGTKKLKSGRTELEGRRVKVSFYIKNSQSRPLFKPWNFIILGPSGSLLEESSWLLAIQILEKCRFSHFHSCKSNSLLARNTNMGKATYLELCPRVRSERAQLLLQGPRGDIQDKAKKSLSVLVLKTGNQLHCVHRDFLRVPY